MTPRQKRIAKAKAKAVEYLIKNPTANPRQVAMHSGVTWITAKRLIDQRQTPISNLVLTHDENGEWRQVTEAEIQAMNKPLPPAGVTLLNEALDVFAKRGETYGDAATHWADVAALWTLLTGHPITAEQATSMMVGLKLLRLKQTPGHWDTIVDVAGYAAVKANVYAANGG